MVSKSRRDILGSTFGIGVSVSIPLLGSFVHAQALPEVAKTKQDFVKRVNAQWIAEHEAAAARAREEEKQGKFASLSPPGQLVPFKDWDYYFTKGVRATWAPNSGQPFKPVRVPEGFVTDLASIPQGVWSLGLRPEGPYAYAALVHDYLYWTQDRPREEADQIFLFAMEDSKVAVAERESFYRILRIAGGFAWDANDKLKKQGERRLLKQYPDDFTIGWDEWKRRPGVFAD